MTARIPPIGTMRDRVQLLRKNMMAGPEGGQTTSFVALATVWARVKSLKGREGRRENARSAHVSHSVVMRFRSDLSAGDRIIYRGRTLDVISTDDLNGRRAYLNCTCSETRLVG